MASLQVAFLWVLFSTRFFVLRSSPCPSLFPAWPTPPRAPSFPLVPGSPSTGESPQKGTLPVDLGPPGSELPAPWEEGRGLAGRGRASPHPDFGTWGGTVGGSSEDEWGRPHADSRRAVPRCSGEHNPGALASLRGVQAPKRVTGVTGSDRMAQGPSRTRMEPGTGSRWHRSPYHNDNGYTRSMPLSTILFHAQKPLCKAASKSAFAAGGTEAEKVEAGI